MENKQHKHKTFEGEIFEHLEDCSFTRCRFNGCTFIGGSKCAFNNCLLIDCSFRGAWFRDTILKAEMVRCNLSLARFEGCEIDSKFKACMGDGVNVVDVPNPYFEVNMTNDLIQIGCQCHSISEWWSMSDDEIALMHSKSLEFWGLYKKHLQYIHSFYFGG